MFEIIDIEKWSRKDHFLFFRKFEEPFFGITLARLQFGIPCEKLYVSRFLPQNQFWENHRSQRYMDDACIDPRPPCLG